MKRKNFWLFLSIVLALSGCKKNPQTSSSDSISSSSSSEEESDGSYQAYDVSIDRNGNSLSCPISFAETTKFNAQEGFILNPMRYIKNDMRKTITISVCGENNYKDKVIIYTPDFHFRKTIEREGVKEYTITPTEEGLTVTGLSDKGGTIIPINGLVISLPISHEVNYTVGEVIQTTLKFSKYRSAIYNQDDERLGFEFINDNYFFWKYTAALDPQSVGFFDTNADSNLVQFQNTTAVSVKFNYDADSQSYIPTNFSKKKSAEKQYMDLQEGFTLLVPESASPALKLDKGVLINEGDNFYFENVPGFFKEDVKLLTTSVNEINGSYFNILVNDTNSTKPDYGSWVYEVAVNKDGYVVDRGVKLSVPTNGYVITIRTANETTIESICKLVLDLFTIGAKVTRLGNTVTVNYDCEDLTERFLNDLNQRVNTKIAKREEDLHDIDITYAKQAQEEIANVTNQLNSLKEHTSNPTLQYRYYNLFNQFDNMDEAVFSSTSFAEPVNMHSVWHYPTEADLAGLQKTLDKFAKNNINEVILDPFASGYSIYNSKVLQQNPEFVDNKYGNYSDYLDACIAEAHKRGMKIQVTGGQWMQVPGVLEKYPEFANYFALNIKGEDKQATLDGEAHYFDPANDRVRELFLDAYDEILSKYDIDGLHLDGIRYGASNDSAFDSQGITEAAREKFNDFLSERGRKTFATMEAFRKGLEDLDVFNLFNEFRRGVVTSFVAECKEITNKHHRLLTAAVVSGLSYARRAKLQAWDEWSQQGIIDGLYLMAYYVDEYYVEKDLKEALNVCAPSTYVIGGSSTVYSSLPGIQMSVQIDAANKVGCLGSSIFAGHSFGVRPDIDKYLNAETGGVYSEKTIVVYESLKNTMTTMKDAMLRRSNDIYRPANAQTDEQYAALESALKTLVSLAEKDSAQEVVAQLDTMIKNVANYGNDKVQARLLETLNYTKKVAQLKK